MTWRDLPDDPTPVMGKIHHAHNLNAFTVAEAEKQWFYLPGTQRPRIRPGPWPPLSAELVPDYSPATVARQEIYAKVMADLEARTGDGSLKVEIHYLPQEARAGLTR
jgi:hypothetical protein